MAPYDSLWLPMASYGTLWLSMEVEVFRQQLKVCEGVKLGRFYDAGGVKCDV